MKSVADTMGIARSNLIERMNRLPRCGDVTARTTMKHWRC